MGCSCSTECSSHQKQSKRDLLKERTNTYQPILYTLARGMNFYLLCSGNFKHHSGKCISKLHNKPHNFLIYLHISCCQGLVLSFSSNTDALLKQSRFFPISKSVVQYLLLITKLVQRQCLTECARVISVA